MKNLKLLILLIVVLPSSLMAQWNMVRFDDYNLFNKTFTASPSTVFLSGVDPFTSGSFILRSNNAGTTWDSIVVNSAPDNYQFSTLFFTDVNVGYAGGYNGMQQGMMKTNDNGTTWTDVTPNPSAPSSISSIYFVDPQTGFASDGGVLYKTNDGGMSWTDVVVPFVISGIAFADVNNGYACGSLGSNAVIMKTADGGNTWSNSLDVASPFSNNISMLKADIINADEIVVSLQYTNVLYHTNNGGVTWDSLSLPLIYEIQDFDFISSGMIRLVSTMGEIFMTSDTGANWLLEYSTSAGAYGPSVYLYSLSFSGNTGYVGGSNGLVKKLTDVVSGINENSTNESIGIYPNPANNSSTIVLNVPSEEKEYGLKIYNNMGQLVLSGPVSIESKNSSITINDLKLTSGIYTFTLQGTKSQHSARLIVTE